LSETTIACLIPLSTPITFFVLFGLTTAFSKTNRSTHAPFLFFAISVEGEEFGDLGENVPEELTRTCQALNSRKGKFLGCVLNQVKENGHYYGYYYPSKKRKKNEIAV